MTQVAAVPTRWNRVREWALWKLPATAIAAVLAVEATAAVIVLGGITVPAGTDIALGDIALAALVAALSVVHTELATGIERIRRRTAASSYFDLSSVWTFAAALLLPPVLTAAVVIVVYGHLWRRVWHPAKVPLYRHVYSTATVLLAATVAHALVGLTGGIPDGPDDVAGILGIVAAVVLYAAVNTTLVAGAIALSGRSEGDLLGRWDDNAVEVATLCMGALTAVALEVAPGLVALALPPILVLHRAVLVRHLEEAASTDAKTGLLNAAAWQAQADHAVRRIGRAGASAAVLILDLDHFKAVNDRHGHLAGDEVLAAVASALQAGVRGRDLVGRFGGEEFVVLLPDLASGPDGRAETFAVAERLRRRIARLVVAVDTRDGVCSVTGLSISIGGALVPVDGTALLEVMKAADASLYAAKRAGRNLVRIAGPVEIPAPRRAGGPAVRPVPTAGP